MEPVTVPFDSDLYQTAYEQALDEYIFVIVIFAFVGIIGFFGNLLIIRFYISQTNKLTINVFILALAVADFGVSIINCFGITEAALNIRMNSKYACQTFYFLYYGFIGLSSILVAEIAIVTYWRICQSQRHQIEVKQAKRILAVTVIIWMIISLRAFLTMDLGTALMDIDKYDPGDISMEQATNPMSSLASTTEIYGSITRDNFSSTTTTLATTTLTTPDIVIRLALSNALDSDNSTQSTSNASTAHHASHILLRVNICAFTKDKTLKIFVVIFHIIDVIFVTCVVVIIVYCYGCIRKILVVHRRTTDYLHKTYKGKRESVDSNEGTCYCFDGARLFLGTKICGSQPDEHNNNPTVLVKLADTSKEQNKQDNIQGKFNRVDNLNAIAIDFGSYDYVSTDNTEITDTEEADFGSQHSNNHGTKPKGSNLTVSGLPTLNRTGHRSVGNESRNKGNELENNGIDVTTDYGTQSGVPTNEESHEETNREETRNTHRRRSKPKRRKGLKKPLSVGIKKSEIQTTVALFVASVALLISFIPYFISTIYFQYIVKREKYLSGAHHFMRQCAVIHSIFNVFIYYAFNIPFRRYVNGILCCKKTG